MDGKTLRKTFLDFFVERGHAVVPSSPVVPDDPTLMFTTAGMVQFKPYLLGEKQPPYLRAASVQKCFRTTDLEIVGKTKRHLTFFEMLGNFSFGDYFKKEAILWAWELVTEYFKLEAPRLIATVHETDDEAAELWKQEVGLSDDRILRRGADNFWSMGVAGPGGPSSELLYDRGDEFGPRYLGVGELDDERYLEIYNLVFMQYILNEQLEIVGSLPKLNVDTGLGFERTASVLQDVPSAFDVDTMTPVLRQAERAIGAKYGDDPTTDVSLRVLAEHGRGMAFLIADGVLPSNEERGYVLRRLIRRAVRYARLAGVDEPVLVPITSSAIELFSDTYPELVRNRDLIRRVVEREELRFDATLRVGLGTLEEEIAGLKSRGETNLPGEVAFKLHDTYGFPLDLTSDITLEEGLTIDVEEFEHLMSQQRTRARAARQASSGLGAGEIEALQGLLAGVTPTDFLGYEQLSNDATIVALLANRQGTPALIDGDEGEIVLDRTTFYAESGGQIGDRGAISTATGTFEVTDTQWGVPGVIVHIGKVSSGEIKSGQDARCRVDEGFRDEVRQSHTATHMLHWALRSNLGEHARQQGSLVEPGRLRFDFSHFEPVKGDQFKELEEEINRRVIYDDSVRAFETSYDFAMSLGATALFGEKYGDFVRVVEVGEYSKELCGGTHVAHTGQVGVVKLMSESSVGAGVRRVEALTGMAGLAYLNDQVDKLHRAAELLRVQPDYVFETIEKLLDQRRELESEISKRRMQNQREEVASIIASVPLKDFGGSRVLTIPRDPRGVDELRSLAMAIRDELGSGIVIIGSAQDGGANLIAAVSKDLVLRGVSAKDLLARGASKIGGGSGGKPDLAIAGGPKSSEVERAVAEVERAVAESLAGR